MSNSSVGSEGHDRQMTLQETIDWLKAIDVDGGWELMAEQFMHAEAESLRLTRERDSAQLLVAKMHEAAVGSVRGPIRGVVEDVQDLRAQLAHITRQTAVMREALEAAWDMAIHDYYQFDSEMTDSERLIQAIETCLFSVKHNECECAKVVEEFIERKLVGYKAQVASQAYYIQCLIEEIRGLKGLKEESGD